MVGIQSQQAGSPAAHLTSSLNTWCLSKGAYFYMVARPEQATESAWSKHMNYPPRPPAAAKLNVATRSRPTHLRFVAHQC